MAYYLLFTIYETSFISAMWQFENLLLQVVKAHTVSRWTLPNLSSILTVGKSVFQFDCNDNHSDTI